MKNSVDIEINLPRAQVIELFDSTENLAKWQKGLLSFEHLSGEPGQPGAKSRLVFQPGRSSTIEMIETITTNNLPDELNETYDSKNVHSVVSHRFIAVDNNTTRWVCDTEFQFSGTMKLIGFLMKRVFPKHKLKSMEDFKAFAEDGRDVNAD